MVHSDRTNNWLLWKKDTVSFGSIINEYLNLCVCKNFHPLEKEYDILFEISLKHIFSKQRQKVAKNQNEEFYSR